MGDMRTNLEIIAPSIEEAVEQGLTELGLAEDAVDVEVLDPGSRGLFGIGSRQARVRITIKGRPVEELAPQELSAAVVEKEEIAAEAGKVTSTEIIRAPRVDDQDEDLEIAIGVVEDLLRAMKVNAQVTAHFLEPDDEHNRATIWVDVRGKDLSILIGPRVETLNALQYIASLIASKEFGRSIPLVVDVEGYRARRTQQLRQLAQRMADQAIKTGRRQVLEPMPASERRIVHIELRGNPEVSTESIGEEPRRKVTIIPK
jgi:spoIIIJ-associated protein